MWGDIWQEQSMKMMEGKMEELSLSKSKVWNEISQKQNIITLICLINFNEINQDLRHSLYKFTEIHK